MDDKFGQIEHPGCEDDCCENEHPCCDSCENEIILKDSETNNHDECDCCHDENQATTDSPVEEQLISKPIKSDSVSSTQLPTNLNFRSVVERWWYKKHGYTKAVDDNESGNSVALESLAQPKQDVVVGLPISVCFFNVEGMTCTGCVTQLESHLRSIPGIQDMKISLLTHKAEVAYYEGRITEMEIAQSIKQAGFTPQLLNADSSAIVILVPLLQSTRANDILKDGIVARLNQMDGIKQVGTEQTDQSIRVTVNYDPDLTGVRFIKEAVELVAQHPVTICSGNASTHNPSQNEIKWRNYLITCVSLTVPLVLLCYVLPAFSSTSAFLDHKVIGGLTVETLLAFLLATPIQFGVGQSLYVSAFQSLKYAKMANMDFLVMLSTTVAYTFSVVSAILCMATHRVLDTFFETSAILLTLIVLGRYMEILTKEKASSILKAVLMLQPSHAILVTLKNMPSSHKGTNTQPKCQDDCCSSSTACDTQLEETCQKDCCSASQPRKTCQEGCCSDTKPEESSQDGCCTTTQVDDETCKEGCCSGTQVEESCQGGCCSGTQVDVKPEESCKEGCCSSQPSTKAGSHQRNCNEETEACCGNEDKDCCGNEDEAYCNKDTEDCCGTKTCCNQQQDPNSEEDNCGKEDDCCQDGCCNDEPACNETPCEQDSGCCNKPSNCCDNDKCTSEGSGKGLLVQFSELEIIKEQLLTVDCIHRGDIIKVTPGSKIPCDGIIVHGSTQVDEAMITGESVAVSKTVGQHVIGGTINQRGLIFVKVERLHSESFISSIYKLIESAQSSKTQVQRVADKVASYFVPAIVALSILTFVVWFIVASTTNINTNNLSAFTFALFFAITVLIISCPCAVSLASPTAILVGTSVAAKFGIIFKSGVALENAHKTKIVVFDKTGTITVGKPVVTDGMSFSSQHDRNSILYYAACCETGSQHIVAQAIVNYAEKILDHLKTPTDFVSLPDSNGAKCRVDNHSVIVGNEECIRKHNVPISDNIQQQVLKCQNDGKTTVYVCLDGQLIGLIALLDEPRKEAAFVVQQLQNMGMQVWIMSGDNQRAVDQIAERVGIKSSQAIGKLLPSQKTAKIAELQKTYNVPVAMIGDGVNDSAALVRSDVGIAVASSTDIAIEAANVILLKQNLSDVLLVFDISNTTFKQIQRNFGWAFLYNFIGIPLSCGLLWPSIYIAIPPAIAGISELFSSVPVILFSLTLKWYKPLKFSS